MTLDAQAPSATALLVGNELLTGKIRDANGHVLAQTCRRVGIRLVEMVTVLDDIDVIAESCRRLLSRAPLLFTSGGVGPTHDDMTLAAIANATGRPLERHAGFEALLRRSYGESVSEAALAMADLPRGTEVVKTDGWPVLRLDCEVAGVDGRIYMLPGVPRLLASKLGSLERLPNALPRGPRSVLAEVFTTADESRIAPWLAAIAEEHPDVEIGSYPVWHERERDGLQNYLRITIESADADSVASAKSAIEARIDPEQRLAGPRSSD